MSTINLDEPRAYQPDAGNMYDLIRGLPDQCRSAWRQAEAFPLPDGYRGPKKAVIIGMGGSAIGGDLARGLAIEKGAAVSVHRDYGLPPSIDADTLLIASSYSGNTEETLSGFNQAIRNPCKKLVLTTGGQLKAMAEKAGIPVFTIGYKSPPRAALAWGFVPLCSFLTRAGFLGIAAADLEGMAALLDRLQAQWGRDIPTSSNQAKRLAMKMTDRMPAIYGAGFLDAVARRWKTQINENSKAPAFFETFPELNHNALVGYQHPAGLLKQTAFFLLSSPLLPPRISLRYEITAEIMDQAGVPHEVVSVAGGTMLGQMMGLVLMGDWVSYYLALLYQVDPTPVKVIDHLKQRLGSTS